jgi:putative ABC transport system ATP-binding protein
MTVVLEGVERRFAGGEVALAGIDLRVEDHEYVSIVGASGSGKSTLLNIVGLLDRPSAGTYVLDGVDTAALGERQRAALRSRRLAFVFQAFHLLPYRSVRENVALALLYAGVAPAERGERAQAALERVGLHHRIDASPTTLSGGERQRVAIARAVVTNPGLLLCDEPTGNLDSATTGAILDLLDELHEDGLTILVITHDKLVSRRAQRLVHLRDGLVTDDRGTGDGG